MLELDRNDRCKKLFGKDFEKFQKTKVLVIGVGGVGGICVDCLARSGVGEITIVDNDYFDITNQNRQLYSENLNQSKVEVFAKKYPNITPIHQKVTKEWVENFDFDKFDIVVDAIDDIPAKVEIAKKCHNKLISSMGSAKRIDPSKIIIKDIWKTYGDKLAKKFRYELKKVGFDKKFDVVFSTEEPKCTELGSFMGVTGSFGLRLCSLVIKRIVEL